MMRRNALAMGAAVLAAAPVVVSPLTASAASPLPSWNEWRELRDYNVNDPTSVFLYDTAPWAADWKYYMAAVMAIVEGVYINAQYEITPSSYQGVSGFYLRNGVRRFGSYYVTGTSATYDSGGDNSAPEVAVLACQDGTLSVVSFLSSGGVGNFTVSKVLAQNLSSGSVVVRRNSSAADVTVLFQGTGIFENYSSGFRSGFVSGTWRLAFGGSPVEFTATRDYVVSSGTARTILGSTTSIPSLPTSDEYSTITADNALDYVENVLNPYMVENDPEIEQYLYTPTLPPPAPSSYPVQETWNNEADWPEGNLLPTIPAASYSVDIPEIMTEGAAFWWRCLGVLFDGLGITAVVVGLLALGIVLYFVLR